MNHIQFNNPEYLLLLLIIPVIIAWYWYKGRKNVVSIQLSSIDHMLNIRKFDQQIFIYILFGVKLLALALIIIAFARPQTSISKQNIKVEGIDIVMATDISSTMLAEDLRPNRLEAAKEVGMEFINGRESDRFGLVVFGGEAFTQCPLTSNKSTLINLFKDIQFGMIDDGTAIGDGLATSINRLKDSKAKSKVIVLLTDGINNTGSIDPLSAAEIAKLFNIRIYTIGVGTHGTANAPVNTPFGIQYHKVQVQIDEDLLKQVSSITNGKYFRATDNESLRKIYSEIDSMEKSVIDVTDTSKKNEEFPIYVILALILLTTEYVIRRIALKTLN